MKLKAFSAMFIAAAAAMSCQPSDEKAFEPQLEVTGTSLVENLINVSADGKDVTLSVKSNVAYTVTPSEDWITADPTYVENQENKEVTTSVKLTVDPNEGETERTATVKVSSEEYPELNRTLTVKQTAEAGVEPGDDVFEVLDSKTYEPIASQIPVGNSNSGITVIVNANVSWTASSSASWLTVSPDEWTASNNTATPTNVTLTASANDASEPREATVTFTGEGIGTPVTVTVQQAAKVDYTFDIQVTDITWTSAYISVIPSDPNVHYMMAVVSAEIFNSYSTENEFIAADMAGWQKLYDQYSSQPGFPYESFAEFLLEYVCYTETINGTIDELDMNTDYVVYTYAVGDDGSAASAIGTKDFKTQEFNASEDYKKWLGKWTMPGEITVNKETTEKPFEFVIAPKSEQEYSVTITGVHDEFGFPAITPRFNEDGTMTICAEADVAQMNHPELGSLSLSLIPTFYYPGDQELEAGEYIASGDGFDIVTFAMEENTNEAGGTGQMIAVEGLGEYAATSMTYVARATSGGLYTFSDIPNFKFPITMTKVDESAAAGPLRVKTSNAKSLTATKHKLLKGFTSYKSVQASELR